MNAGIEMQTKQFEIQNPQTFDDVSPSFEKQTEIGYFSLDINREFEISKKSLRYFIRPKDPEDVAFNLRKGYDTMIRTDKEMDSKMLEWIVKNMEKFPNQQDSNSRNLGTDFVSRRGLLAKIMCTPYEKFEDWLIAVIRHNGTYYLHEIETEQKRQKEAAMDDKNKEMCCWGWKFEQYLTSDSKDGEPKPDAPYNNCEEYFTVVRTKLGDHSLVFHGEVDALNAEKENSSYYTEFKTSRQFAHEGDVITFKRHKIKKWWAQSYITGVKEIVCGFRDDEGIVHNLKFYNTEDLPGLAQTVHSSWKSNVCLNALDKLLSFIKASIKTDDHRIVHTLKWSPGQPVLCSGPFRDSEYNFLPAWYTDVVK